MENSPRAISAAPARSLPRRPTPSREAAYQPVRTLVSPVATASTSAAGSTGSSSVGTTDRPMATKNTAANRSRSGAMTARARSTVCPVRVKPTRNAPTAAEACTYSDSAGQRQDADAVGRYLPGCPPPPARLRAAIPDRGRARRSHPHRARSPRPRRRCGCGLACVPTGDPHTQSPEPPSPVQSPARAPSMQPSSLQIDASCGMSTVGNRRQGQWQGDIPATTVMCRACLVIRRPARASGDARNRYDLTGQRP